MMVGRRSVRDLARAAARSAADGAVARNPADRDARALSSQSRGAAVAPPPVAGEGELLQSIKSELDYQRRYLEILRATAAAPILEDVQRFADERRLGYLETLDHLYDNRASFARYGDGEIRLMFRDDYNIGFQKNSVDLQQALRALFLDDKYRDKVLLGFPYVWRGAYWATVWTDVWPQYRELASHVPVYGLTQVTRPLFFTMTGDRGVQAWRRMWDNKRVCVITGKNSRFTLLPELFDNVADVRYIHSLPKNAFTDVPRVLEDVRSGPDADLYLLSLGPSGTVLAAELAVEGRWALDIGHISASYRVAFQGARYPERESAVRH